jgi:hypothetical protein
MTPRSESLTSLFTMSTSECVTKALSELKGFCNCWTSGICCVRIWGCDFVSQEQTMVMEVVLRGVGVRGRVAKFHKYQRCVLYGAH